MPFRFQISQPMTPKGRNALCLGLLVCFIWTVVVVTGTFQRFLLPDGAKEILALVVPIILATPILYRSDLYPTKYRATRIIILSGISVGLFIVSFAILGVFALFLFAI